MSRDFPTSAEIVDGVFEESNGFPFDSDPTIAAKQELLLAGEAYKQAGGDASAWSGDPRLNDAHLVSDNELLRDAAIRYWKAKRGAVKQGLMP